MQLILDNPTAYGRALAGLSDMVARCRVGERLPPERELCAQFNVSRPTIRKALGTLARHEIVEIRHGSGAFVRKQVSNETGEARQTKLIGFSAPTIEVPAIARAARGAEHHLAGEGYRVVLVHDQGDPDRQARDIEQLLDNEVQGLLIFLDRDNVVRPEYQDLLKRLRDRKRPVVLLDRYVPGVDLPCVLTDTVRGMYLATEHLILLGRRRPAVLSWGPTAGIAERNRLTGFRNALRDHNLPTEPVLHAELGYGEAPETAGKRAVEGWLRQHGKQLPFDAIVCFLDNMAYGAFAALKEAGLSVPEDVALVGFDNVNSEMYQAMGLELTSVDQPFAEMGKVAADMVLQRMRNEERAEEQTRHVLLAPKLVVRSSCGEKL
jgi:DNA-binding LacI/PurR family transcriptional regulator